VTLAIASFGSKESARIRRNAAIKAHADFIATDQYEDVAQAIRAAR
jgi:hypothetical protein